VPLACLIVGQPAIDRFAWETTFDAIVELHRGNATAAFGKLSIDRDDEAT
jgi:hypothetical protein